MDHRFRKQGYRRQLGVRAAIGALLEQSFPKSKFTTTSNWAAAELSPKQLLYAYAALVIKQAVDLQAPVPSRSRRQKNQGSKAPISCLPPPSRWPKFSMRQMAFIPPA